MYARTAPDALPSSRYPSAACGSERWTVKTLTDDAAAKIDLAKVKTTTVEGLRLAFPSPNCQRIAVKHRG